MPRKMNFGRMTLTSGRAHPTAQGTDVFRLALLGDFSSRANKGELQTGSELAKRKPLRVDVDNLDATLQRLGLELRLPLTEGGDAVEVSIGCMDDFHPDELFENLELFGELGGLRRRLSSSSSFADAAREVQDWLPEKQATAPAKTKARSGATVVPRGKLSDFARLLGSERAAAAGTASATELIKQIVAGHVVPADDPQQEAYVKSVDEALSSTLRSVLHHPDFQAAESLWRSVDLLTRQLETSMQLQIVLYDMTAEEIAADLSCTDDLTETGLYRLFVQEPVHEQQGPLSVLVGNYLFEQTPPHAELLGRIAQIAAAAGAPFITGLTAECIKKKSPHDIHPLIIEAWSALRAIPEARYLGLVSPRFMLRWPYGAKTEPIDPFSFEEFTPKCGLQGMLWGNGAILAGLLLGQTFTGGGSFSSMQLGSVMTAGDMPFYYYTDSDGDQMALPCTERVVAENRAMELTADGVTPLLSIRGRPEVRLAGFQSVAGDTIAGPWNPVDTAGQGSEPEPTVADDEPAEMAAEADTTDSAWDSDDDEADTDEADTDEAVDSSDAWDSSDDSSSEEAVSSSDDDDDGDDELDSLLAELESSDSDDASDDDDDDDMDPELKALLDDL